MEVLKEKAQLQRYTAYKDSGVEWLGEVPEHWESVRMKFLYTDYSEKNKKDEELLSVTQDKGVVPRSWVENRMVMPSGNLESFKFIQKGDFAISLRSFEGGLEYCHHDGIISPAYTVLKQRRKDLESSYYKYLFKSHSFISELQTSVVGIREGKNISFNELSYSLMPIPRPEEQTAIANFLDKKCGKIDTAITQKQKLIELLKERKQIVIQELVTGKKVWNKEKNAWIEPVEVRDSGVEWIGEIPEHWEVKRLKNVCRINLNSLPETTPKNYEFQYVDIGSVSFEKGVTVTETYKFKSAPSRARRIAKTGDTVISTVRTYLKAIDFVDEVKSAYIYSTGFAVLQPESIVYPEFLAFLVKSNSFTDQVTINSKGMSYPAINSTDLSNLFMVHSDYGTQKMIVRYFKEESAKLEKSINLNLKQIEKLREYKSSLIDAAVTGKIKVS
ncbi:type I restriction enzyme, S subunit [Salegentibacter echinorum]|uniref:Type I restriction enzyme, S subunit n=1 Tax=Salegentibacter echinorum TaxID=1073325 RepID=A0A1M5LSQ5_SALEC|nr:restriction endonuclease subunit S [Salegentibacter echinorum]SHG68172.1 type I restriction enzyme, S subunit [Salegentibacter echinorum]